MAAKGEQVDISELAKNEQLDNHAEAVTKEQASQPQTTTGAQSAAKPTVTGPAIPAAQSTPVATSNASTVGNAMPQALLNTGNSHRC
jgi:hypothetical protein